MECVSKMDINTLQGRYGNGCQFVVIDPSRLNKQVVVPVPVTVNTGTQTESRFTSDPCARPEPQPGPSHAGSNTGERNNTGERVVILEEGDGLVVYRGERD